MIRQIGLLQSGAQTKALNSTLHFSEDRIIYSSSLAVYILNSETYLVEKILCSNQKSITSLSISPVDKNLLVVGSVEGIITVWNIEDEIIVRRISVSFPVIVSWDPFSSSACYTLALDSVRLYSWDTSSTDGTLSEMLKVKSDTLTASLIRSNPKISGLVAIGCNAGTTILYQASDKSTKLLSNADKKLTVEDMQWDRLSTSYLLIAYKSHVELWDTDSASLVHSFDKQPLPIRGIAWMDWTAGNFISFNNKNNNLKVWNASQKHPIETIKIRGGCDGGLTAISFNVAKKHAIFASVDGSIVVYDVPSANVIYRTPASHTETIFDCEFCPSNPYLFATCSFDTTVKLWNLHDFSLVRTMHALEGVLYSVSWSPSGKMLLSGTSLGEMIVWDAETGHELARYKQSSKQIYRVQWNPHDERIILNSTADGNVIVTEIDIDFIRDPSNNPMLLGSRRRTPQFTSNSDNFSQPLNRRTIAHPGTVYGVAWSPFQATIFATCCHDGLVRIFNYAMMGELLYTLKGHNARVFTVIWSPIVPGLLATASDDRTVLIWNINEKTSETGPQKTSAHGNSTGLSPVNILSGHTNNVRAICWSHELRDVVLTGSWDSTIRVWNTDTGHCLATIRDHNADVYSICAHPHMPFTFLSSSRDNTIRLWEMSGITKIMRYYAIWDGNFRRLLPKESMDPSNKESEAEHSIFSFLLMSMGVKEDDKNESKVNSKILSDPRFMMHPTLIGTESGKLHRSLTDGDSDLKDLIGHSPLRDGDEGPGRMFRRGGAKLERNLPTDPLRMATIYYKLFTYFNGASGVMDIWENAITILENQKTIRSSFFQAISSSSAWLRPTAMRQVLHESEVLGQSHLEAQKLITQTKVTIKKSESTAEENQLAAALAHMRMGEFSKYCSIMIELGKWEAALAAAPSVSLDYWRFLSNQYALYLKEQSSEMAVPHLICIGKDADAVDYYLQRSDTQSAMTIAKMSEQRKDVIPDLTLTGSDSLTNLGNNDVTLSLPRGRYTANQQGNNSNGNSAMSSPMKGGLTRQSHHSSSLTNLDAINIVMSDSSPVHQSAATRERTEKETEESRVLVRSVAQQACRRMLKVAQPLLAAAHLLSVENIRGCIDLLMLHHEPDLAYALAKCFKLDTTKIAIVWADQCAGFGALDLALEILDEVRYNQQQQQQQQSSQQPVKPIASTPQKPPITGGSSAGAQASLTSVCDGEEEIALLVSKYAHSDNCADDFLRKHRIFQNKDRRDILDKAKEDEAIGNDGDAITGYVMARAYSEAVVLGIRAFKRMLNDAFNLTTNGKRILHALKHVRAMDLEDRDLKVLFLCYMLWFAAHRAARKGAFHAAHTMLNILLDYASRTNPPFPIPASAIQYQMMFFMIYAGDNTAYSLLNTILSTELPSGHVREGLRALNLLLKEEKGWKHWIQRLSGKWNRFAGLSGGNHAAFSSLGSTAVNSAMASPRYMTKMPATSASPFEGLSGALTPGTSSAAVDFMLSPIGKNGKLVHTSSFGETMMNSLVMNTFGHQANAGPSPVDVTLNLIVSVIGEIHKLTDALELPSLTRLSRSSSSRTNATNTTNSIDSILDLLLSPQPVIQGSLLPVSNQQLKAYQSCVDNMRRLQGRPFELEDHASMISINEAASWIRFHGFSPLMTGDFLPPLN